MIRPRGVRRAISYTYSMGSQQNTAVEGGNAIGVKNDYQSKNETFCIAMCVNMMFVPCAIHMRRTTHQFVLSVIATLVRWNISKRSQCNTKAEVGIVIIAKKR
eukprot:PhF_6_TR40980/c0_g1_i1/m.62059